MNQDQSFNGYQQLVEAARTPDSQLTGPEDQQMALQNTSQAQQAGHNPPLLNHNRTPYDTEYFETGLGRVHRQHSHQQQRQEQPPHIWTPYDTQYFETGLGRVHRQHSQQQQRQEQPPHIWTPYDTQYFETGLGRVHQQHSQQQQRQVQPPHHRTHRVQTDHGLRQQQPSHHQHYPIYPVHDYQPLRRRTEINANLEGLSAGNAIPLESDTTELEGTSAEDAIEIESYVGLTEYTIEYPEGIENRNDAKEPGMGSYTYDSPTAEEEAAMDHSYATPEHGDSEAPTSLDDAGPSASNA